jgi:hypothetical protein
VHAQYDWLNQGEDGMAMSDVSIAAQIKSIEMQLAVLKARLSASQSGASAIKCPGDLYGILRDTGSSSEEDIGRALYTFDEQVFASDKAAK